MEILRERARSTYQKLPPQDGVRGFLVHVHDGINLDIDLELTPRQRQMYSSVIQDGYSYTEYSDATLHSKGDVFLPTFRGLSYRCHLRGTTMNKTSLRDYRRANRQLTTEVQELLNFNNGQVICSISDIDIYARLLVDVFIPAPAGLIDLRQFLLNRVSTETYKIITPYPLPRD